MSDDFNLVDYVNDLVENQGMSSATQLGDLLQALGTDRNIPIADGLEVDITYDVYQGIPEHFFNAKIRKAREFAEIVHSDQKYDSLPYTRHLADTYKVFLELVIEPVYGKNTTPIKSGVIDKYQDIACALWLHDAIEDTTTTRDEIEEHFGTDVADLVEAVSGVGKNRKERLDSISRKIEDSPDAIIIKLCDRIANTRYSSQKFYSSHSTGLVGEELPKDCQMFAMYVKEFPDFKKELGGIYSEIGFIKRMWEYLESISKE